MSLADRHGLVPRLHQNLAAFHIPPQVLDHLRAEFEIMTRRALWLTQLLLGVVECFRTHGIPVLAYKGPALAETLYHNLSLRQFNDLDLLIHPRDWPRAKSVLGEIGFTPHLTLGAREEKAYVTSGYERAFDGRDNQNIVEIQWRVLPRFYAIDFDLDRIFERAQTIEIAGQAVPTLSSEDLLLVLCVHAAKHVWGRLLWLSDIAELSAQPIAWSEVLDEATRLGIERILGTSFSLCQQLLASPVPPPWEAAVRSKEIETLSGHVLGQLARGEEANTESPTYFRLMMNLRERASDKIRFLMRLALTPSIGEWSAVRLPPPLFPLYRGVRFFRLLGKLRRMVKN